MKLIKYHFVFFALFLSACASNDSEFAPIVLCHEINRGGIVSQVPSNECAGNIITPAQAEELRVNRQKELIARLNSSTGSKTPDYKGYRFYQASTGFAINERGDMLTTAHSVRGCQALAGRDNNNKLHPISLLSIESGLDLALIRAPRGVLNPLAIGPEHPKNGVPIALIGYPKIGLIRLKPKITVAYHDESVVSGAQGLMGINGEVRSGNSGGPVLNSQGQVIGVVTAHVDSKKYFEQSGELIVDKGAAARIDLVKNFLNTRSARYKTGSYQANELTENQIFNTAVSAILRVECYKN